MYWTNATKHKIQRANLDGTNVQDIVTTGLEIPEDIVLNVRNNTMYWTDWGSDKIQRANLDGTNVQDLIVIGLQRPVGIALKISEASSPLTFNPSTIPDQTFNVGTAVTLTLPTATGGTAPYSYSLAPALPLGLYFDPIGGGPGYIGGTPTTVTPSNTYTYTARDAVGASGSLTFTIEVIRTINPDVNGDGQVDVFDLALVALAYGTQVPPGVSYPPDVNGDGKVDLEDLTIVARAIDAARAGEDSLTLPEVQAALIAAVEQAAEVKVIAEAPTKGRDPHYNDLSSHIAYRNVAAALADARHLAEADATRFVKELAVLKALLTLLAEMGAIPETTALLMNYPNPFNPETWIPYHLATDAEVILRIYDTRGVAVRELMLGHQTAGVYESRARAAYWDGKNAVGEPVASGVYFYTFTADDFTATRKLLIIK